MKLSILICSLEKRAHMLDSLLKTLHSQEREGVEIIVDIDRGEKIIGQKRNELLDTAMGDYVCFIDDDDEVPDYYVHEILDAIKQNPDCIGFELIYTENGGEQRSAYHSIVYNEWATKKEDDGKTYYERTPNHLNPIKREIALKAKFPEKNFGEDHEYSNIVQHLVESEVYIDKPMYFYKYVSDK